jgi:hypothetical protein
MDSRSTKTIPEKITKGEVPPRKRRIQTRLLLTIERFYERVLKLPPVVVCWAMWMVGLALLGAIALVMYLTAAALVRLISGAV